MANTALPNPEERPTLTVEEAAAILGISRSLAYEAVRRGELPSIHFGRRVVVPTAALLAILHIGIGPLAAAADPVEPRRDQR